LSIPNKKVGLKEVRLNRFQWKIFWIIHDISVKTPHHEHGSNSQLLVIGTDCTGSCKSNYHMTTTMTAPRIVALFTTTYTISAHHH